MSLQNVGGHHAMLGGRVANGDMEKHLTSKDLAAAMGVSLPRVRALLQDPCPRCQGTGSVPLEGLREDEDEHRIWDGDRPAARCPRCRGTGQRVPHEHGLRTGFGAEALIYPWVLEIDDLAHRRTGRGLDSDGVVIEQADDGYHVSSEGEELGVVQKDPELEGRRRSWMYVTADGAPSSDRWRSARSAAKALALGEGEAEAED